MRTFLTALGAVVLCFGATGCHRSTNAATASPIVGVWLVKVPEAPFGYHMFTFHSDGTVLQSNPDAGDANSSDSNGMGVWTADGDQIKGKFVEVTADRTTHQFASRGEISFVIKVTGNTLSGAASANFYDASGQRIRGPLAATMTGERIMP